MSDDGKVVRLQPAQPDTGEDAKAYKPRLPWKWIVPALLLGASIFGALYWQEVREMAQLRGAIIGTHSRTLAPMRQRIDGLRGKIERLTLAELSHAPNRVVDPRLNVDALYRGHGMYLRIRAQDVHDRATLSQAAKGMQPDAIMECLGLAPKSARTFYQQGEFLTEGWRQNVDQATSIVRLEVLKDDLNRRIERDLPAISTLLESDWFMLAIERGQTRGQGDVDVYLWDLRHDTQLLALRTQGVGGLLDVRAQVGEQTGNPAVRARNAANVSANDCSIASQIRQAAAH